MACRNLILILGDQLNLDNPALEGFDSRLDRILMVEATAEATHVWSHKARIALFLAAMRHFAQTLIQQRMPLIYLQLGQHGFTSLSAAWEHYITELKPEKIMVCEPGEYRILLTLQQLCAQKNVSLVVRDDTHFFCSQADFKRWAGGKKELRMEFFYRDMRKKHRVLMDGNQPHGGAWNFDAENRKPFGKSGPEGLPLQPSINELYSDADLILLEKVFADVEAHFANHPGSLGHFIWPIHCEGALKFLQFFIAHKLAKFGDHQDAMWADDDISPYLWHSLLSTSLNLKLLNPREVIRAAEEVYHQGLVPLASAEGFIRQILGWREFIRGMYWLDMPHMAQANHYDHQRDLPSWYWTGETHMNCMRQTIKQTLQHGYAHHIQRLMVTGMFGVLAQTQPQQMADWYLAMYVDAVEWVELPNVAGMALFANGGRFTSKPYIASGAYIKRMSNYCNNCLYQPELKTGEQACPVTTLYWHFLITHYDDFAHNPRTSLMVRHVDNLEDEAKAVIMRDAQQKLAQLNAL